MSYNFSDVFMTDSQAKYAKEHEVMATSDVEARSAAESAFNFFCHVLDCGKNLAIIGLNGISARNVLIQIIARHPELQWDVRFAAAYDTFKAEREYKLNSCDTESPSAQLIHIQFTPEGDCVKKMADALNGITAPVSGKATLVITQAETAARLTQFMNGNSETTFICSDL